MKKEAVGEGKGGFTLPGEAGYEELTLKMARKWGADIIRDSDGTSLSEEIIQAGYGIYSTLCLIREHNQWARGNLDKLQQTFLCTPPVTASSERVVIGLLESFFAGQFTINDSPGAMEYWQVYDRTTDQPVAREQWEYRRETGQVWLYQAVSWHQYTVSFLAYRIWEEISMYNHTTNGWDKEHLMQLDPRYPEVREYLRGYLRSWCEEHPDTTVVRFTSLFYNFVWIWGSDSRNRHLFADWGSYDFAVSDLALAEFEEQRGYRLTAEDFINQGKLQVTHMPATEAKKDWMAFIHDFVVDFGRELVEIVHSYGKLAYVFYDDSWVGLEPYGRRFGEFGFDGLIKCVFSGYEVRLCAGVGVPVHELRLHPYLFPVGLGGGPTFMAGGDPALDARRYWVQVRRALLFAPIERIGLGGYLHLVEGYPDFCDYIEKIADEFRLLRSFHQQGGPQLIRTKVAVLHSWGKLRSWTLSGHFHETHQHDLIHINEALAGLPIAVTFLSFEDVIQQGLAGIDVVINAGRAGSAWSGGAAWREEKLIAVLTEWVYKGGTFLGVNEPAAVSGYDQYFRMAHVLGVDEDTGARVCHGRWQFTLEEEPGLIPPGVSLQRRKNRFLTDGRARVLLAEGDEPLLTVNPFGQGRGIYLASFQITPANTRLLYQLLRYAGGEPLQGDYMTDNLELECAWYPAGRKLVVVNNNEGVQTTEISTPEGVRQVTVPGYDTVFLSDKDL